MLAAPRDAFWWTALWLWVLWNLGSVLGALLGSVIGDPSTWGLDAAFPAGFVALLVPHVRRMPGRVAAIAGAAIALVAIPITPGGVPLLLAAVGVVSRLADTRKAPPGDDWGAADSRANDWGAVYGWSGDWGAVYGWSGDWGAVYGWSGDWGAVYGWSGDWGVLYGWSGDIATFDRPAAAP